MPAVVGEVPGAFIDELSAFTSQAVTGIQIGLFRAAGIRHDSQDSSHVGFKKQSIARYLNDCWKSLILRDDEFVVSTFEKLHDLVPNESPLCLIHKIAAVSFQLLQQNTTIGSSTPISQQTSTNEGFVNVLRTMLREIASRSAKDLFTDLFTSPDSMQHECTGPKFPELLNEDPNEPIFSFS